MLRKASEAVSEGNGPVHQEEYGFGQPAAVDEFLEVKSLLKEQEKMLKELRDDLKDGMRSLIEQFAARPEWDARQPRLAMDADGPESTTKTRERTEGAATAVQALRGGGFSARRVEPGPNTNSTSFGVKAEHPALPCRDDIVVECGDATSESYLPSLEMRSPTAAGGLVPTGKASTATETNFNQPLLGFARPRRRIWRRKTHGLQFHPPHTTAAASSRRGTCLLLPTAGGSLTQNPGKI